MIMTMMATFIVVSGFVDYSIRTDPVISYFTIHKSVIPLRRCLFYTINNYIMQFCVDILCAT